MADIKWTWNFDVYDESDSPTEEGYYRIIDDEGNEMTDYYFNELKMTPHGVGYWRDGTRPIIAWRFLGKTENSSEIPNNCEDEDIFEYCPRCGMRMLSKWYEPKDEPQTDMAEDIVRSFGFKAESYRQAKAKDEPQTERSE